MDRPAPIAVVGLAFHLPGGADNLETLEELLQNGRSGYGPVPKDRWNSDAFYSTQQNAREAIASKHGYFLRRDISKFDARFFQIGRNEACSMDPKQRILLQTTYEALENAGIPIEDIRGSNTSVHVSTFTYDYERMGYRDTQDLSGSHVTGTGPAILSNRISYVFDLKGPSFTLDTGCSGGLIALHQACQSLRLGESSTAIVGGAQLLIDPDQSVNMNTLGMINADGHCYAFDSRGSGYGRGEGIATLILKPLDRALADRDHIHTVIVNSGINQDGKSAGSIMSPLGDAQRDLMRQVYVECGLDAAETPYVEAHGTGTKVGDQEEISSIHQVFTQNQKRTSDVIVGSVKANIGHLEASAGLAGLLKSIVVLRSGIVPPQLHFEDPKPGLNLAERKIHIPKELVNLPKGPSRASINSFGYGGTNCHVIIESLESYIRRCPSHQNSANGLANGHINGHTNGNLNGHAKCYTNGHAVCQNGLSNGCHLENGLDGVENGHSDSNQQLQMFILSANSETSLKLCALRLRDWVAERKGHDPQRFANLAHTLLTRRSLLPWRQSIVASNFDGLHASLSNPRPIKNVSQNRLAFVFTGQGAQWAGMGRELITIPAFERSLLKSESLLSRAGCDWSLSEEIFADEKSSNLSKAELAQPATTALQIALVDLLTSLDVKPSCVVGHSSGEIAAAYAAGALTHEAAIEVAYHRGVHSAQAKQKNSTPGRMMAVGLGENEVRKYLDSARDGQIRVACINSPKSTTISGEEPAIDELKRMLDANSTFARKLNVDTAYHSHHMQVIADDYKASLGKLKSNAPHHERAFYSTVTASRREVDFGADYWVRNLVSPVRFSDGLSLVSKHMKELATTADSSTTFIEIGPSGALAGPAKQTLTSAGLQYSYVSVLSRKEDARLTLLTLLGQLLEGGYRLDKKALQHMNKNVHSNTADLVSNLPTYPFDESSYWTESRMSAAHRFRKFPHHDLCGLFDPVSSFQEPRWRHVLNLDALPWLKDHVIDGAAVFPASGYIAMVVEAMRQLRVIQNTPGTIKNFLIDDVTFSQAISFSLDETKVSTEIQLVLSPSKAGTRWHTFRFFSYDTEGQIWNENCAGVVAVETSEEIDEVERLREQEMRLASQREQLSTIQKEATWPLERSVLYQRLEGSGNAYGPTFSLLDDARYGVNQGLAKLEMPDFDTLLPGHSMQPHVLHPTSLDAIIHVATLLSQNLCLNAPMVVGKIHDMTLSADLLEMARTKLQVASSLNPQDTRTVITKTIVFDATDEAAPVPLLTVTHTLQAFKTVNDANSSGASGDKPPLRVVYQPDAELLAMDILDVSAAAEPFDMQPQQQNGDVDVHGGDAHGSSFGGLAEYLGSLVFKHPRMKLLQIGAQTGAVALPILTQLSREDGGLWLDRYDIADRADASFETTKTRIAPWADSIQLRTLDILQDPAKQGFDTPYDIIVVAPDVLHDASDLEVGLKNCRQMLQPGSKLVQLQDRDGHGVRQQEDFLHQFDYSGIDMIRHCPSSGNAGSSVIVTTAVDPKNSAPCGPRAIKVICGWDSDITLAIFVGLQKRLSIDAGFTVSKIGLDEAGLDPNATYIVLDLAEHALLLRDCQQAYEDIQRLLTSDLSVVWIALRESSAASVSSTSSMIQGASRVLRRENGGNSTLSIFNVDDEAARIDTSRLCDRLAKVINSATKRGSETLPALENEYVYRDGNVLIPRLEIDHKFSSWIDRHNGSRNSLANLPYHQEGRPLQLEVAVPGLLSSMRFSDDTSAADPLQPWEIQVSSRAHGVNFKDVFISMGQMPPSVSMVGEVAGVITAVGKDMQQQYSLGDRIMGFFAKPFASLPRFNGNLAHIIPPDMDFKTAATIPCTYATAYHCLFEVARFKKGQSILITAASGGVGQAAIQLAQHAGAGEIFVTLGSESKKQLVMETYNIPESHVFSSRKLNFKQGIRRLTNGRGVDVVINSLAGDMLSEAFDCLAKLGTFCEIGKGDIYKSGHLNLKPFDRSITFAAVDLVVVAEQRPEAIHEYLAAITGLFEKKLLQPVSPINVFGIQEIENAFRLIAGRKHTGKIVLDSGEQTIVKATLPKPVSLELPRDGVYVIAGGLGGVGKHLTGFLASKGAGHIVLLSRRKFDSKATADMANEIGLPSSSRVHILQCDITQESQVVECAEYCKKNLGPVRGIIHSAMLLKDRPFSKMSLEEFSGPLGPKVYGTLNLDKAFTSSSLDFFIMLSSSATIIGNGSQANYTAANAFQDGFARAHATHPRTNYVALNLGAVEDTAAISSTSQTQSNRLKSISITIEETMRALEYAMSSQSRQDGCVQPVLGVSRQAFLDADDSFCLLDPLFSRLPQAPQENEEAAFAKKSDVKGDIRAAKTLQLVQDLVRGALVEKCAAFLDRSVAEVPLDLPLSSIGFDSLVSIELKNWIIRTFEATVQTAQISSAPSVTALAATIASRSKLVGDEAKANEGPSQESSSQTALFSKALQDDVQNRAKEGSEFECCLVKPPPKLPLPSLDDYLQSYEESVSAFAYTASEQEIVRKSIEDYRAPGGLGRTLYHALEKRAGDDSTEVWYTNPETLSLLTHFRHPIVPWNVFVHTHHDSDRQHSQAERAALISTIAFQFLQGMNRNEVEHDWLGPRPLCSYSWLWMFGSVREPRVWCDKMQMYPDSRHVAVLRKGHLFRIPLEVNGQPVSFGSMKAALQSIIDLPLNVERWGGIMTTDFRDPWAVNREKLLKMSSNNVEYFKAIEEATFVICLDDRSPITNSDRVWQALLDDGSNRWFDKTTQFVVSANGRSAHLAEHTMVDGTTPLRLTEYLHDAITSDVPKTYAQSDDAPAPVEELTLQTTADIDGHIERLRLRYKKLTATKSYRYLKSSILSHSAAAGTGISAKSCLDLAIQLAGRLHFKRNVATWEPVSMQHYHKGRPDIMQPLEKCIARFCDAAADDDIPLTTKKKLMKEAATTWEARIQQHRNGNGYLRRSEALLGILAHVKQDPELQPLDLTEEEVEGWTWADTFRRLVPEDADLPSMYTNPVFQRMYPGEMYHVLNEGEFIDASAFVMGDGKVWISKRVRQSYISLSISGDVGDIDRFEESFKKAAHMIREIIRAE